jgi:hypothetical protein
MQGILSKMTTAVLYMSGSFSLFFKPCSQTFACVGAHKTLVTHWSPSQGWVEGFSFNLCGVMLRNNLIYIEGT